MRTILRQKMVWTVQPGICDLCEETLLGPELQDCFRWIGDRGADELWLCKKCLLDVLWELETVEQGVTS